MNSYNRLSTICICGSDVRFRGEDMGGASMLFYIRTFLYDSHNIIAKMDDVTIVEIRNYNV